jgi:outer membrane immunogenic protein
MNVLLVAGVYRPIAEALNLQLIVLRRVEVMNFRYVMILAATAACQLVPLGQPANAADLPSYKDTPYVVLPWQGLYFGAHGGGVWGGTNVTDTFTYVGDPTLNGNSSSTGLIAGGQLGYNIQRGNFVFGPEADIGFLGLSTSKSAAFNPPANYTCDGYPSIFCGVNANYTNSGGLYGDLTGRLGYATDRSLLYVKGGLAVVNDQFSANYQGSNCTYLPGGCWGVQNTPSAFNFGHSETLIGWTLGAGAEYALSPAWSLKAEYQHFDFGKMSYSYSGCVPVPGAPVTCPGTWYTSRINGKTDISVTADAVSVGVNYHLGESWSK